MLLIDPDNEFALEKLGLKEPVDDYTPTPDPYPYRRIATGDCDVDPVYRFTPYYGYINYGSNSIKRDGHVSGLYMNRTKINSLEFAVEHINIEYRDDVDLQEVDFITNFNYNEINNLRLRIGGRGTSANSRFINGAWAAFLGAHLNKPKVWELGVDTYFSQYDRLSPNKTIFQMSPRIALENQPTTDTRVLLEFKTHYINTEKDIVGTAQEDFYSSEVRLQIDVDRWTWSVFGWTGEQTFAVRQDGFLIFNLAELHTGGYGTDLTRTFKNDSYATLRFNGEQFSDFFTLQPTHSAFFSFLYTRLW